MDCMQAASCLYLEMTIPISGGCMMMYRSLDAASIPLTCFGKCLWDGYVCRTILLHLSEKICQGCFVEVTFAEPQHFAVIQWTLLNHPNHDLIFWIEVEGFCGIF